MTPSGASDRCRRARHPRLAQGATPQRATRQAAPSRPGLGACQRLAHRVIVDPQLGRAERHVLRDRAARPGELPDAVDRVVIVVRQDQPGPRAERVGLPDEPARAGGVRGEDGRVLLRRRVEVREDREPGPLDQFRRRGGGRVFRVRVPEAPAAHPLGMGGQLRLGRQARTGVVEVDVPARVEVGVFRRPQPVKQRRAPVAGVRGQEAGRLRPPVILRAAGHAGPLWQGSSHDFPRTVADEVTSRSPLTPIRRASGPGKYTSAGKPAVLQPARAPGAVTAENGRDGRTATGSAMQSKF